MICTYKSFTDRTYDGSVCDLKVGMKGILLGVYGKNLSDIGSNILTMRNKEIEIRSESSRGLRANYPMHLHCQSNPPACSKWSISNYSRSVRVRIKLTG